MKGFDLQKSPIRQNIQSLNENQLSVFEEGTFENDMEEKYYTGMQVRTILQDVENMLDIMEDHGDDVIHIAVMGEVKAGKSTFINALVGREVAYTDILEATAVVSEITYSEEEYVHLLGTNGKIIRNDTLDEMLEWMEEMVDEEGDFSGYSKIEIGLNDEDLRDLVIVDTPGLLSITSQNHEVTNKYVAETDYILWVINSHNLGSKAVNDYIDKIKLSGKPIIGIINKVDSSDERKEIEEYIFKEYGSIFEEIFFVSSKAGWDMLGAGDIDWKEKTGFEDIIECIEELKDDKNHSVSQTRYYQLQREKEVHVKMRERIKERKTYYDNEISVFAYVNAELKKTIKEEIKRWLKDEFFINEKQNLLDAGTEQFPKLLSQYSDSFYLTGLIEDKYNEIAAFIYKKWNIIIEAVALTSSQVDVDFTYDKTITQEEGTAGAQESYSDGQQVKDGLIKGAMVGIGFAGYWAWLGPAAATETFVGSLVPCAIPFMIAGTVAGMVKKRNAEAEAARESAKKRQAAAEDLHKEVMAFMAREGERMEKAFSHVQTITMRTNAKNTGRRRLSFTLILQSLLLLILHPR